MSYAKGGHEAGSTAGLRMGLRYPWISNTRPKAKDRQSSQPGWSALIKVHIFSLCSSRNSVSSSRGSSTGTCICPCASARCSPTVMMFYLLELHHGDMEPQEDKSSCSISGYIRSLPGMIYESTWPSQGRYRRPCMKNSGSCL